MSDKKFSLGIDFGTDSVRALIVDVENGKEVGNATCNYPRWSEGKFCDKSKDQYRQHPQDHIESMGEAVRNAVKIASKKIADISNRIIGIGVDTTGSTPGPVDKDGNSMALNAKFENDPNAMFIMWKDHMAVNEADDINKKAREGEVDHTQYCGGTYSSEWFWSKILYVMRNGDKELVENIYSWMEHADWVTYILTGANGLEDFKRSRCAAGHKCLWHESWKQPFDFLKSVDDRLGTLEGHLYDESFTSDQKAGLLCDEWSEKFGLPAGIPVAVGVIDAHAGAVGVGIKPGSMCRIVGTSTCDMVVATSDQMTEKDGSEKLVKGICGQVDGSIIPGLYGMEAGQSAVGDVFANFRDMFIEMFAEFGYVNDNNLEELKNKIYGYLTEKAEKLDVDKVPLVIPYHSGRRIIQADQTLTGCELGLTLATDTAARFAGLVQGTCYEARQIRELFVNQGIDIDRVIACGGIADKSPYVMQTMADIMGVPIEVSASDQSCALGAAIFGAVVGEAYQDSLEAVENMSAGFKAEYKPRAEHQEIHKERYEIFVDTINKMEDNLRKLK